MSHGTSTTRRPRPRGSWPHDVRAVHGGGAPGARPLLRAGRGGPIRAPRRAPQRACAPRLRRPQAPRPRARRLAPRRLRRRGHRRRAARRRAPPALPRAAAGGDDGDRDRGEGRARALRAARDPPVLPARPPVGDAAIRRRARPGVPRVHGDRALAEHAADPRRAGRAGHDRQRKDLGSFVPSVPSPARPHAPRPRRRAGLRHAVSRGRAADHRPRRQPGARRRHRQHQARAAVRHGGLGGPLAPAARLRAEPPRVDRGEHASRRRGNGARGASHGAPGVPRARAGDRAPSSGAGGGGPGTRHRPRLARGAPQRARARARAGRRRRARHGRRAGAALHRRRRRLRRREPRPLRRPQHAGARPPAEARAHGAAHGELPGVGSAPRGGGRGGRGARRRGARPRARAAPLGRGPQGQARGRGVRSRGVAPRRRARDAGARQPLPGPGGPPVKDGGPRFLRGWEEGFPKGPARLLGAAGKGYSGLLGAREWLYARGVLKSRALPVPVVPVGNLTGGGTGKTRAVEVAVQTLTDLGYRPAVVSRGYGRRTGGVQVVADAASIRLDAEEAGDEPFLLARRLPGVPVVVGSKRYDSARLAVQRFGVTAVVLDDAFRHRTLTKDLEIVMARARNPWGNGALLPAGPLREPLAALRRAHLVVATGAPRPEEAAAVVSAVNEWAPGVPVLTAVYALAEGGEGNRMRPAGLAPPRGSRGPLSGARARRGVRWAAERAGGHRDGGARHSRAPPGARRRTAPAGGPVGGGPGRSGARRRPRHVSALVERAALHRRHRTGLRRHDRGALADLVRGGGVGALLGSASADRLRHGWAALAPHRPGSLAP